MVFFSCNNCGESFKKAQVANHLSYGRCRGSSVSCLDCHRDFDLQAHVQHTKCITEAEKYSGGNYKARMSTLNTERKRMEWGELVAKVAADRSAPRSNVQQNLLNFLSNLESVPVKYKPFMAMVNNGAFAYKYAGESVWKMLEKARDEMAKVKAPQEEQKKAVQNGEEKETPKNHSEKPKEKKSKKKVEENADDDDQEITKKKKKKSKNKEVEVESEEKEVKKSKKSKKKEIEEEPEEKEVKKSKKSKKVKEEVEEEEEVKVEEKKSKKKKKEKGMNGTEEKVEQENGHVNGDVKKSKKRKGDDSEETGSKKAKLNESEADGDKFSWKEAIMDVMSQKGNASLKKVKRKVIAKYHSQPQAKELSDEKLESKFKKTLQKMSNVTVENDKVVLVQEV